MYNTFQDTYSQVNAALAFIPAHDRETWLAVGTALKTTFGEDGFALFDKWSQTSPDHYHAASQRSQWRSFRPQAYKVGTIFHLARAHGWQGNFNAVSTIPAPDPEQIRRQRQEDQRLARQVAQRAAAMIRMAEYSTHPYLRRKGFPQYKGFCYTGEVYKRNQRDAFYVRNRLLIPIFDTHMKVMSVQLIAVNGSKLFLPGGTVRGGKYKLGREKEVWICEGWATALSLRAALTALHRKCSVWVSFMASNTARLAQPDQGHIVVADHDVPAIGVQYGDGEKYGRKSGCPYYMPPEAGDLNDMHQSYGLDYVKEEIRSFAIANKLG